MPDISKLKGSPRTGTDTRWSQPSVSQRDSTTRRPTRPTENALCSHVWNRTRTLTPDQTLRIRDAIPYGDTERTDDLDVPEWTQFAASIQACRPSIIPIAKELGIMMASFPNCPEDQCRIQPITTAAQVMSRNNLQNHFGTRAISTPPSLYSQLMLAEDMSIVEGQGDATLQSYNQHLWGLRREYGRSRDSTIDWNRPGETVDGARLTLGAVYEGLSTRVHQTVYVDPPTRVSDAFTEQPERGRGSRDILKLIDQEDDQVKLFKRHLDELDSQYDSIQTAHWEHKDEEEESENTDKAAENADVGNPDDDEQGPQPDWFQKDEA